MKITIFLGIMLLWMGHARARIFDINSEKFAAYLGGTYGPSYIDKVAFSGASNFGETYDSGQNSIYSGEFGFIYSAKLVNFRFALEVIRPLSASVVATDSTGQKLYDLDSGITAITPKIGLEINIKQWKESRLFINGNIGSATMGLNNSYVFTPYGTTTTGKTDYSEEGRATANLMEVSLGWEFLLFDTTTIMLTGGYRNLKFESLTHNRDANTLAGAKVKGDPMLNIDGSQRAIDLTGYFAGLGFRFWVF